MPEPQENDPKESKDVFSVNDYDIERGIFNLVIALVKQKSDRMGDEAARQAVVLYLDSLKSGLEGNTGDDVNQKIDNFIRKQREEETE